MKFATVESGLTMYWKKKPQDKIQYNTLPDRISKIRHIRYLAGEAFSLKQIIQYVDKDKNNER